MTLLLVAINTDCAVLVSDRRLTRGGAVWRDDTNKTVHLMLNDGRLAVAYTGLAEDGPHVTSRWLLDALLEASTPDGMTVPTLEGMRERAMSRRRSSRASTSCFGR